MPAMDKKTVLMLALSGVLMAVLAGVAYYKSQLAKQENVLARANPDKTCDLHKNACQLDLPDGRKVRLSIDPKPIPLVTKFDIQVNIEGEPDIKSVLVDFKGTSMNMGPNTVKLTAKSNGQYNGNGMLPVCVRNSMEWQAEVWVRTDQGTLIAPFLFVTHK